MSKTRKAQADELIKMLERGPEFTHLDEARKQVANYSYSLWAETWIIPVVQRLVPELNERRAKPPLSPFQRALLNDVAQHGSALVLGGARWRSLQSLLARGLIRSEQVGGRIYYILTEAGEAARTAPPRRKGGQHGR